LIIAFRFSLFVFRFSSFEFRVSPFSGSLLSHMGTAKPSADLRTGHPYYMHEAVHAQPALVARVLAEQRQAIDRAAEAAAAAKRILFIGIGTSSHAAALGECALRHLTAGRAHAQYEQSFEFTHYPVALSSEDFVAVVSHRGWKAFSVEALKLAKKQGARTLSITGEHGAESIHAADFVVTTCEQEICFAHTKSYTTALAVLAALAIGIAERRGHLAESAARAQLAKVPDWMRQALASEAQARDAAKAVAKRERLLFTGAGPNWYTAWEAALKVKETSYLHAEGFEAEQFLHGPLAEVDARASLVALLNGGPTDARNIAILRAAAEVGALCVAVANPAASPNVPAAHRLDVPAVPEWLAPLVHIVPLQLFTYYIAIERGTNPDTAREHEPAHSRAKSHYQL
jgi:glucosamine--fructose-6-phosphate aminotransferase (isomerizing)